MIRAGCAAAVDPRWKNPSRQKFLTNHLAKGYELIVPKSFKPEDLRRELESAVALVTGLGDITEDARRAKSSCSR